MTVLAVLTAALALLAPPPAAGSVIIARRTGAAVIVWNAGDAIAVLRGRGTPDALVLRALEARAVDVAAARAPGLAGAVTIAVRVVYARRDSANQPYGTPLGALERLLTVRAGRGSLLAAGTTRLAVAVEGGGALPSGLSVELTGVLPAP